MINTIQGVSFLARKKRSVRTTMLHVMAALLPGTILYSVLLDFRIFSNLAIAGIAALVCESICLKLRARPVLVGLGDGSTLLASWLMVLCLPPSLPAWQVVIGAVVLVTLGKHIYGGLGQNPFNPAMVAYAFLLVSFPVTMTTWEMKQTTASMHSIAQTSESNATTGTITTVASTSDTWDGITGATALDRLRELKRYSGSSNISDSVLTQKPDAFTSSPERYNVAGDLIMDSPWVWISFAWFLGGLYLLIARIITWHIPASVLLSISSFYVIANISSSSIGLPLVPALLSGGIILGAFFIATDPVSAAASRQGQIIYGLGIGSLTVVIREFSVYPEGIAFAVLLMNMCVPFIDYLSTGKKGALTSRNQLK